MSCRACQAARLCGQQVIPEHTRHKGRESRQCFGHCLTLPPASCQAGVDDASQVLYAFAVAQILLNCLSRCAILLQSCSMASASQAADMGAYSGGCAAAAVKAVLVGQALRLAEALVLLSCNRPSKRSVRLIYRLVRTQVHQTHTFKEGCACLLCKLG